MSEGLVLAPTEGSYPYLTDVIPYLCDTRTEDWECDDLYI